MQKRITDAYHVICTPCANTARVCAKCQEKKGGIVAQEEDPKLKAAEQRENEALIEHLSERQRRSYLRKVEKGTQEEADEMLEKFKKMMNGDEGEFDLGDFDDMDEFDDEE